MTDWKELARKHEESANEYARMNYELEAENERLQALKCLSAKQAFAASNIISHHHGVGPRMDKEVKEFYDALRDYGETLIALGGE